MNDKEKKQFGERLRNLAAEKGVTQTKLAEEIGAHKQNVCLWMCGKTVPVDSTIHILCEYFGCTREYLLYGRGEEKPEKASTSIEELALAIVEMRDLLKEIRDGLRNGKED